jgi:hypothetical protein
MNGSRFDAWTRRRFGLAAGNAAAALLGLTGGRSNPVVAKKNSKPKTCKKGKKKCGKKCIAKSKCCGGCGGQTCCDGKCRDLANDGANCGACGNVCSFMCVAGECTVLQGCPSPQVWCDDICVDLEADPVNCGACGNACVTGDCIHGACRCGETLGDCPAGCSCGARAEGGDPACFSAPFFGTCDEDGDCPVGSVCLVNNKCSSPCLG